ncbi:DUF4382 domain-containing protein [Sediminibacterium soli]|uniref:DUF4382 domain-containing protein n=1 Tax=Sediminibacterium soli TaxID=2698829 RepID=UPI00137A07C9|nr:DUF4382 domain-containing protein [Sediminibacterium soli]NCI45982.1 DUF4382 domain-containing protein [Sediminibacterium soli]
MKNNLLSLAIVALCVIGMAACKKSTSDEPAVPQGKEHLSLYLTDGPGLFDKVLIDIRSVKVLVDTSANTRKHDNEDWDHQGRDDDRRKDSSFVWETLNIKAGVYDILTFRNGADTLLAASNVTKGSIRLIKIEIGTNNSLVKDNVTYPLNWPANMPNYVLLKLRGNECESYLPGKKRLWVDFDVSRSIVENNNGFYLKPVFHFFVLSTTGTVAGKVTPREGYPVVTVFNGSDTAYALPNRDGYFKVRGLGDGTYSVFVNASNGYADTTITNVVVKAPKETSIGAITLHK